MSSPNSDEYIVSVDFPIIMQDIDKFLKPQKIGFELSYSGTTYVFNVTHFTSYRAEEDDQINPNFLNATNTSVIS